MAEPELRFVGGSIIPIMIQPESGLPIVVLAAEPKRTRLGRAFNEWDGFGGHVEDHELVEVAAAREFMEESLGLLCVEHVPDGRNIGDIAAGLTQRSYLSRVDVSYLRRSSPTPRFLVYTMFFVQVKWDPMVCRRFQELRERLLNARFIFRTLRPPPVFDEGNLLSDAPFDGRPLKLRCPSMSVKSIVSAGILDRGEYVTTRVQDCEEPLEGVSVCVLVDPETSPVFTFVPCQDSRPVRVYVEWVTTSSKAREQLAAVTSSIRNHPALSAHGVSSEYLEKQFIRLFTIPHLLDAYGTTKAGLLPAGVTTAVTSRFRDAMHYWLFPPPM